MEQIHPDAAKRILTDRHSIVRPVDTCRCDPGAGVAGVLQPDPGFATSRHDDGVGDDVTVSVVCQENAVQTVIADDISTDQAAGSFG